MDPFTIAAGSALIGGAMNLISGGQAAKEAARARAAAGELEALAQLRIAEAVERLEKVGIPTIEAQRIILETPELVGLQDIPELGKSAYEDIAVDPRLAETQKSALDKMAEFESAGMTDSERAQDYLDQQQVAGEEMARRKAILQKMAEQGTGTQGAALAAQLEGSSAAAQRRAMEKAAQAAQRDQRRMAAIQSGASLAGGIRSQEFGELAQKAGAKDRIRQFDLANRMQIEGANLDRQQQIENMRAAAAQQQELHNKGLIQQNFQNEMQKEGAIAGALTRQSNLDSQMAQNRISEGQARAGGALQQGQAIGNLVGNMAGAYLRYGKGEPTTVEKDPAFDWAGSPGEEDKYSMYAADGGIAYADGGMVLPPSQPMAQVPMTQPPNNNAGYKYGGVVRKYAGGGVDVLPEDSEIIPGDDFAGDRVDAKINSGEMVLNIEQQQRLMDLLKGYRDLKELGDEDIIEPASKAMGEASMPPMPESSTSPITGDQGILMDQDLASYGGMGPLELKRMALRKAGEAGYRDGGLVQEGEKTARGLTQEYAKMTSQAEQMKEAQKNTNARIKAIETLMGLEKAKK